MQVSVKEYVRYYTSVGVRVTKPIGSRVTTAAITWRIRKGLDLPGVVKVDRIGSQYVLLLDDEGEKFFENN